MPNLRNLSWVGSKFTHGEERRKKKKNFNVQMRRNGEYWQTNINEATTQQKIKKYERKY